jgi:hypothetical protein
MSSDPHWQTAGAVSTSNHSNHVLGRTEGGDTAVTSRRLRFKGHGTGLRLSISGDWSSDPIGGVTECCRALMALEKALGESIRQARSAGHSWADVGRALGATETAASFDDVADVFAANKRATWELFWTERAKSD